MTNGDRIRQMSDEELADFIDKGRISIQDKFCDENAAMDVECDDRECTQCWLEWLRKEANDDYR